MLLEVGNILTELNTVYPGGPYSWSRGGAPFTTWDTIVHPNLVSLKNQSQAHLETVGLEVSVHQPRIRGSGSSVPLVPWMTARMFGQNSPNTAATQGVYVNYLFGMDGLEVFLVLGLATTPFIQAHFPPLSNPSPIELKKACRKSLEDVSSVRIDDVKGLFRPGTLNNGEFTFSATDRRARGKDWQYACPYWIRYDSTALPTDDEMKEDLENMVKLYNAIAEQRMITSLDVLIEDIQNQGNPIGNDIELDGALYSKEKLRNMLRNFSIIPYEFKYADWSLEYSTNDWERLSNHSNYLRLAPRSGYSILTWDYKITKTNDLDDLERLVHCHKTVILEGPPGVGKTYFYNQLVKSGKFEQCELITFNPATENSDFIGGLTPVLDTATTPPTLKFDGMEGIFVRLLRASANHKVLLWIDEVNRGNVAKIFGEFIGLLGTDEPYDISIKNIGLPNDVLQRTDYNLDNFHVVGTLNTADQSISTIDLAIRRRFQFVRMYHDFSILESSPPAVYRSDPSKVLALPRINAILDHYGSDAVLGHSYLYELEEAYAENPNLTLSVWEYSILPNLIEILMREQIRKEDQELINKELRPIGFNIIDSGNGYGAMKIIVPVGQTGDAIPHLGNDEILEKSEAVLKWQNNMILEGVPGVGKTWMVRELWDRLGIRPADIPTYTRTVTFGPATEPEDFVGGLFPQPGSSPPTFEYIAGVLMELAIAANDDPDKKYVLFIDEINRGNLPKVMGALMTIMETSKRYDSTDPATRSWTRQPPSPPVNPADGAEYRVALMHENGDTIYFGLPKNLYIIGAMNTSDRSVIHLDGALRRRFSFMRIDTMLSADGFEDLLQALGQSDDSGYWMSFNIDDCRDILAKFVELNELLWEVIGPDGVLGHSYFFDAGWCKPPINILQDRWETQNPGGVLSNSQIDIIEKIFRNRLNKGFSSRAYIDSVGGPFPSLSINALVGHNLLEDLGVTPKNYRVAPEFDGYDQAFWQGFWDQFSYAILPQLADTLNAFAINEAQAAGIIEKSDEITTLFMQKHDALEAQSRYLRPPPEIGSAREWRVE